MRLILLALSLLLWFGGSPSFAADQSVDLSSGRASFLSTDPVLDGGDDVITFTNLASGTYNFVFSLSSQYIAELDATLNGLPATTSSLGVITYAGLQSVGDAPFVLTLTGTPQSAFFSLYSGELTVQLVPEAGTLLMLFAGLAGIGVAGRRR
jgi:hypothetical protein